MRMHLRVTWKLHLMQTVAVYMMSIPLLPCPIAAAGPLSFSVLLKQVSISTILYYPGIFEMAFSGRHLPALSMQIDPLLGNPTGGHKSEYFPSLWGSLPSRVNSMIFCDFVKSCVFQKVFEDLDELAFFPLL